MVLQPPSFLCVFEFFLKMYKISLDSNFSLEVLKVSRGWFNREGGSLGGGLFTNSDDKDIYDSLSVLLPPYFTDSTYNLTCQMYKFNKFYPKQYRS